MGGPSSTQKAAAQAQLNASNNDVATQKALLALQQQIYGQISPYASAYLQAGTNALAGQAPEYFQLGERNALNQNFQQAGQNLVDQLGRGNVGLNSGLAAGPLANLEAQKAMAVSGAQSDAINQALNLGLQGANVLQGQQGIFNPVPYGQLAMGGFNNTTQPLQPASSFWGSLGGALTGGLVGAGTSWITKH